MVLLTTAFCKSKSKGKKRNQEDDCMNIIDMDKFLKGFTIDKNMLLDNSSDLLNNSTAQIEKLNLGVVNSGMVYNPKNMSQKPVMVNSTFFDFKNSDEANSNNTGRRRKRSDCVCLT